MNGLNVIHVRIGEVKTGKQGDLLKATLGSCVGIAFLWKSKGIFGLAHCLLPETEEKTSALSAKFVNQAVLSLMKLMKINPEDVKEIEVHIAGGGNMMSQLARRNVDHVGMLNAVAAKKYLALYGFHIKSSELGGEEGRQISVDCSNEIVSTIKLMKSA